MAGLPSSYDDVEQEAIAALKTGKPLGVEEESMEDSSDEVMDDTSWLDDMESQSTSKDDDAGEEDELALAGDSQDGKPGNKDTRESIEIIKADGKNIKVDFNDREHIKKVYQLAAGARKWQAERDEERQGRKEDAEKSAKLRAAMDRLEEIKDDDEELYRVITGGKSLADKFQEWQREQDELAMLSPAELESRKRMSEFDKRQEMLAKREAAIEAKAKAAEDQLNNSLETAQRTMLEDAFSKHRFAGNLGNADDELVIDEMLWSRAKERLNSYERLTPELVNREVEALANTLRRTMKIQGDRKADKIVERRKESAAKAAQKAVVEPGEKTNKRKELASKIKSGDYTGIMANMSEFFKVL